MTESLRIFARMFKAFYLANWVFYGIAAWALVFGVVGALVHDHGRGMPMLAIMAPFLIAVGGMAGQEREAGRLRAILALPIPSRTLATWWWLTGCALIALIAEAGGAAYRLFYAGRAVAPRPESGAILLEPGAFLLIASLVYGSLLASHKWSIEVRKRELPMLEGIGALFFVGSAIGLFLFAGESALPRNLLAAVGPLAVVLAAIGWFASPVLLPSHSFLNQRLPVREHARRQQGGGDFRPSRLGSAGPIVEITVRTSLAIVVLGAIWAAFSSIVLKIPMPGPAQHGSTLAGYLMPKLVLVWLFAGLGGASLWTMSARSLRVLPWSRFAMTAYLASLVLASLAAAVSIGAVFSLFVGVEGGAGSIASIAFAAGGAGLLVLPLIGAYGFRAAVAGLYVGSMMAYMVLVKAVGEGGWAIPLGLIVGTGSLVWFHSQLAGAAIYKHQFPGVRRV